MNTQNIDEQPKPNNQGKTGLDEWNERLDSNLETEHCGDELADERADHYSKQKGSGDQSDDSEIHFNNNDQHDHDDNIALNHPYSQNLPGILDREE
ncbi:hypothetical protein OQX61_23120 [Pedobacter sp. PLR]|uniref:hypothetical protein n=1 Tax=Pedobacter sp. PLR TaxID=2994465 RepID=UPI0022457200|nr:hypothetical protein [Pedobacter sp. PLR]MCX2454181.1 hypothetical protein [Pedobacter sp. PLR]